MKRKILRTIIITLTLLLTVIQNPLWSEEEVIVPIDRSKLAGLICQMMGLDQLDTEFQMLYKDINNQTPYANSIIATTQAGLFKGIGQQNFNPSGLVSREMIATVLIRCMGQASEWGHGSQTLLTGTYEGNVLLNDYIVLIGDHIYWDLRTNTLVNLLTGANQAIDFLPHQETFFHDLSKDQLIRWNIIEGAYISFYDEYFNETPAKRSDNWWVNAVYKDGSMLVTEHSWEYDWNVYIDPDGNDVLVSPLGCTLEVYKTLDLILQVDLGLSDYSNRDDYPIIKAYDTKGNHLEKFDDFTLLEVTNDLVILGEKDTILYILDNRGNIISQE